MEDSALILAAEDCPPSDFKKLHKFSTTEENIITKLRAHGPILLRGGRGSGKSALMIEASRRLAPQNSMASAYGVYVSLRHLTLLRSANQAYERYLCEILTKAIRDTLKDAAADFQTTFTASDLQQELARLSEKLSKRLVIFFDDAAHIGREASLSDFFDIYRTISSSTVSCKASIYPGVTKFGNRFDILNDATVIDLTRNEEFSEFDAFFLGVMDLRFSENFNESMFGQTLSKIRVARILGQSVLGNMRAFIFACDELAEIANNNPNKTIGFPEISKTLNNLAENYYWPLLDEIKPKLGTYAPLIETAENIASIFNDECARKENSPKSVLVFRENAEKFAKPLEILEYSGFISKREASRAMRSGGRGSRYVINLCTLLEKTPGARLTTDLLEKWSKKDEPVEFHRNSLLSQVPLPEMPDNIDLEILQHPIDVIKKSKIYPYGLTDTKIELLKSKSINTINDLANMSDEEISSIYGIGDATITKIRNLIGQAIWM